MQDEAVEQIGHMRVVKMLAPTSRGAIKLHEQFGKTLICVRHRVDAKAKIRFTTVELLIGTHQNPQRAAGRRQDRLGRTVAA